MINNKCYYSLEASVSSTEIITLFAQLTEITTNMSKGQLVTASEFKWKITKIARASSNVSTCLTQTQNSSRALTALHAYNADRSSANLFLICSLFSLSAAVTRPVSGVHASLINLILAGTSDFSNRDCFAACIETWEN